MRGGGILDSEANLLQLCSCSFHTFYWKISLTSLFPFANFKIFSWHSFRGRKASLKKGISSCLIKLSLYIIGNITRGKIHRAITTTIVYLCRAFTERVQKTLLSRKAIMQYLFGKRNAMKYITLP